MASKEVTAEEALRFFYDLANDGHSQPDMVHGMLGAVGSGMIKLTRNQDGEIAFIQTEAGIKQAKELMETPEGKELKARFDDTQRKMN